jgi:2-dehydro-3-deoxy-D-gluconate 5-dehydrogenase
MKLDILEKFSLKGRVAVITGTTKGLGRSLAEALVEAGATVVALDRSDNPDMANFCAKIEGSIFKRIYIDLLHANEKDIDSIINSVIGEFSRIDILVNNAGITRRGDVHEFNDEDWLEVLQVNLTVPFYLSRSVSKPFMVQRSGKIINIASMLSFQGGIRVPSYASSKHGITGLTKSFAVALGPYGINVNAIAPGFISTDMNLPLQQDPERNASIIKRIPMGRWGQGDDLKGILIYLSSSMSDYVNGAIIPVDGGWLTS